MPDAGMSTEGLFLSVDLGQRERHTQRDAPSKGCKPCSKTLAQADVSNFVPDLTAPVMQIRSAQSRRSPGLQHKVKETGKKKERDNAHDATCHIAVFFILFSLNVTADKFSKVVS